MEKYIYLTLLCLFLASPAQSETGSDSLRRVLKELSVQKRTLSVDSMLVVVYCDIGKEYSNLKNDSAQAYFQKALTIAAGINHKPSLLKVYSEIGRHHTLQFMPIKGLEYCFKALILAEELNLYPETKFILRWISYNYMLMNDIDNAVAYYRRLAALSKSLNKQEDYLLTLINIGVMYFSKKDYTTAMKYFGFCERANKALGSTKVQAAVLVNTGKTRAEMKDYDKALGKFKEAILIEDGYSDRYAFVNNEIAKVYFLKANLNEALKYATIAKNDTINVNDELNAEISKTLSEVYEKLGNISQAYTYYKDYARAKLLEDSTKNSQLIRLLKLDYENEINNQKIAQLNFRYQEKESRAKLLGFGLIALIVFVIIVLAYSKSLASKNKLIEKQKEDIQKLNESLENKVTERTAELTIANEELKRKNSEIRGALLKGQTMERERVASELHDNIGGTLTALKWRFEALDKESLSEGEQRIYDGILRNMQRAYGEVRLISHNMLPAEFEEQGLTGALGKFVSDLNLSSARTTFKLDTSGLHKPIRQEVALELYICCFETVNNIIKHAGATKVVLEIAEEKSGNLLVSVEDNGKGFDTEAGNGGKGLKNIRHRADKINAKFEIVTETNVGSKVLIRVPELFWEESMLVREL